MNQVKNHPAPEELAAFAHGQLAESSVAQIAEHLERCDECCTALRSIPDDVFTKLTRTATAQKHDAAISQAPTSDSSIPKALASLERYEVEDRIGVGGMGEVYRAQHKLMQRTVALKVINPTLVNNPEAISRFRNEVRAAASLSHPNIVSSFDAENVGDLHFLVMELVDGTSLANVVAQNGSLDWADALDVIEQAASGLEAAYKNNMVHRDIKPQNLMLTNDAVVKILDFGLARIQRQPTVSSKTEAMVNEDRAAEALIETSAGITGTNLAMGTPDYVAPEQARDASSADARSDIYSLGCTFRFLLTGKAPFPNGNSLEKISQHLLGQPQDIRTLCDNIPQEVALLLDKMMGKEPSTRFQSPAELLSAIAEVKRQTGISNPISKVDESPSRRWLISACVVGLLLAAIAGATWGLTPPAPTKVLVVAPTRAYYPDYESVKDELNRRDIEMTVAAFEEEIVPVGEESFEPFNADLLLRDVRVEEFDAIIFIGGEGTERLTNGVASGDASRIIAAAREQSVPLGGVCIGLNVLQNCGVSEVREMLSEATEERLMTFDGIVTAVDTEDIEAFVGRLLNQ